MWISKRVNTTGEELVAERGNVVSSGESVDAGGTVGARNTDMYSPYGYKCVPPVGEEVILLPSSKGQVIVGTKADNSSIESGEIEIASLGGARLVLKNDGTIILNSLVIDKNGVIKNDKQIS